MHSPTPLDETLALQTGCLWVGRALAKLECRRPSGGVEDRLTGGWSAAAGARAALAGSAGAALAAAAWARPRGVQLFAAIHGGATHEVREALAVWGVAVEEHESPAAAQARAAAEGGTLLATLEDEPAAARAAATLGAELVQDVEASGLWPAFVIGPAGCSAALAGAARALRARWPGVRVIALCAAGAAETLPELPAEPGALVAGFELARGTRADAQAARAALARQSGLLAGHAGALAATRAAQLAAGLPAGECGVALVTATGEREFSLDPREESPR